MHSETLVKSDIQYNYQKRLKDRLPCRQTMFDAILDGKYLMKSLPKSTIFHMNG